ncbi:SOS-response transcriptional repressor LexA (RecA-mediated autopeptidase) [Azotobacter beijerinckii]|uniref:SOS-response transcriptional repressor LexA (RecA-mediated autopeptidase) n=1 Tax=Azotobacter beijerinckii TaxID=170623 RepID=A0A1H6QQK3_9GAMM|nr:S24 family peptidase [Azotobacter beijerinckii]SEI41720.1 SOS-response transcriptional repressor LexA (RecA-mediated autopeptidase) [Azotobacter beijerinckii]
MSKKKPLSAALLAECQAANALFLSKKNALGLSQKLIADTAGISPASVSQYLNGTNALNARFAAVLAKLLDEPIENFSPRLAAEIASLTAAAEHSNVAPMLQPHREAREYPVISWIAAGERIESSVAYPCGIADEWLSSTENAGPRGYWLRVKGKSMTADTPPSFPEGTPILIRPEGFELISGKFYIARHRDGETTFKQYIHDAGVGYLVPLNSAYQTVPLDGSWEIIGRAIDAKITGM